MKISSSGQREIESIISTFSDADLDVVNTYYAFADKRVKQDEIFTAMRRMTGVDESVVDILANDPEQQIALETFTDGFIQLLAKYEYATELWLRMKHGEDAA
ncbi:MAG: hypothetical protein ACR5LC_14395 [Symbiopectobacterium sp.]|uniref:hypothetical protein n=1 Tax=Symbiopectobacterium sp. TaxID=2952789 RepID=UPI003F402894